MQLGINDIGEPGWTDMIHDEWIRNVAAVGISGRDRLLRTRDIMKRVLPGQTGRRGETHMISTPSRMGSSANSVGRRSCG